MWAAGALRGSPGVDDDDPAAGPGQDQGGGEAGGATADDCYVVLVHASSVARAADWRQQRLLFPGIARCNGPMTDADPDRRRARPGRSAAAQGAGAAGRHPDRRRRAHRHLEEHAVAPRERPAQARAWSCCCPLAQVYRVPLDDLVGAPEVGDPRIRLKPRRVNGRTVLPLTRHPGGVQAWKIVIPADQSTPEPAHPRRLRVALRPDRPDAAHPGRPGPRARGRRGGRVRHPAAALVRQHRARVPQRC